MDDYIAWAGTVKESFFLKCCLQFPSNCTTILLQIGRGGKKEKAYWYYALKYRDGKNVVNKHIPNDQAPALKKKLEQRRKLETEMRAYKKKIVYLSKILKAGKG